MGAYVLPECLLTSIQANISGNSICPKTSKCHAEFFGGPCVHMVVLKYSLCLQATMGVMMSESIMARYKEAAMADMIESNMTEIRCPCKNYKLRNLIRPDSGVLENHLLVHGFMRGYTLDK